VNKNDDILAWWKNGRLHRTDIDPVSGQMLHAVQYGLRGYKWAVEGNCHRVDKHPVTGLSLPAIWGTDEDCEWLIHGRWHREDGPAVRKDDRSLYYWNGAKVERAIMIGNATVVPQVLWTNRAAPQRRLPEVVLSEIAGFAMPQVAQNQTNYVKWLRFMENAEMYGPGFFIRMPHLREDTKAHAGWKMVSETYIARIRGVNNDEDRKEAVGSAVYATIKWGMEYTAKAWIDRDPKKLLKEERVARGTDLIPVKNKSVGTLLDVCRPYKKWWNYGVDIFIADGDGEEVWDDLREWCDLWGFDFAEIEKR
jgi:hypothetical protein